MINLQISKVNIMYHKIIQGSSKRASRLKQLQEVLDDPCLRIKEIHSLRWLSYYNALTTVCRILDSLLTYLAELHATGKDPKASGLCYSYYVAGTTAVVEP